MNHLQEYHERYIQERTRMLSLPNGDEMHYIRNVLDRIHELLMIAMTRQSEGKNINKTLSHLETQFLKLSHGPR